jgi:thiol-disulfide isomerase/thioredoxin
MKRGRILIAGTLGLILAAGTVAWGDKPGTPTDKAKTDKRELLKDEHADPKPADGPDVTKPEKKVTEAKVSDDAKAVLAKVTEAYQKLTALNVAGTLTWEVVAGGAAQGERATFTGSFEAPNKFRHEIKGDMVVGSTGEKAYAYRPERNDYKQTDAPKERVPAGKLPSPMKDLVQMQNVGLMCAIVDDAGKYLAEGVNEIVVGDPVSIDGTTYTALDFRGEEMNYRVLLDPKTHLVRRVLQDVKRSIEHQGRDDVEKAMLTYDYTAVTPGATKSAEPALYAWAAPEGSREAVDIDLGGSEDAMKLVGKDAPDFQLKDLDNKDVQLSAHRGRVVVLDFWATWCGPCKASLPELNKLYKDLKGRGMSAFAIDLEEDKDTVQPVAAKLIPDVPALLDEKGDVGKLYAVGGIPQTVVIGKDGKIKKVFIGAGSEAKIRAAVESALKE